MPDQLSIYNGALNHLGLRELASLAENREPRRVLDGHWSRGFVRTGLEEAQWTFGNRTLKIEYDQNLSGEFGFRYAFPKPSDYCRTMAVCSDEYFRNSLTDQEVSDEGGYWWSDYTELYVKIVSDDALYGGDLSLWPEKFTRWRELELAVLSCERLTQGASKKADLQRDAAKACLDAKSIDAMNKGAKVIPAGRWTRARHGSHLGYRDRGSRTQF